MLLQTTSALARIPAEPPIHGPIWTIVVPALLLIVSTLATAALYRRFAGKKG